MNQQELGPESKGRGRQSQDGERASTYDRKTGNRPKEEHPSTFEDTVPPYVYRAQDSRQSSSQAETQTQQRRTHDSTSSRANRSYTDYQQQQQQQQQPRVYQRVRETRPRRGSGMVGAGLSPAPTIPDPHRGKNPIIRWVIIILLALALFHILPFIGVVILSALGILAVALLLPIFILLGLVAAVVIVVLIVLSMLGVPIRRRSRYFHR
jgi:hypothetical protein